MKPLLLLAAVATACCAAGCAQEPAGQQPQQPQQLQGAAATPAAKPEEPLDFMRYVQVDDEHARLEVQLVRYRDAQGREVTLVPAVHVADAKHFDELNRRFAGFDAVLYELIAEPDQRPLPGQAGGALTGFQRIITEGLEVEFQLDGIDYQVENLVHADLTPAEFRRMQRERGESIVTLMLKAMTSAQLRPEEPEEDEAGEAKPAAPRHKPPDLVKAIREGRKAWALKLILAPQFEQIERVAAGFDDNADGKPSVLLGARNERAIDVLKRERERHDRLAIYYGGAHMPDIDRRIRELGFAPVAGEWTPVWDIRPPAPAAQDK